MKKINSINYLLPYGREFNGIIELGITELAKLSISHHLPAIVISPTLNRTNSSLDKALARLNVSQKNIAKLNSKNKQSIPFTKAFTLQRESIETIRKLHGKYVGFAFSCHPDNIKKIERASCFEALIIAAWQDGYDYFNNQYNPMLLNHG